MLKGNDSSCSAALSVARSTKKPYKPPKVTEYGNVARLTAAVHGSDDRLHHNNKPGVG